MVHYQKLIRVELEPNTFLHKIYEAYFIVYLMLRGCVDCILVIQGCKSGFCMGAGVGGLLVKLYQNLQSDEFGGILFL